MSEDATPSLGIACPGIARGAYDVAIIGAGVAGCCCARELARTSGSLLVLEAGDDIACGATRANSGIVHAGYDPEPGTLKARYNVEGSRLYPMWAAELGFSYVRNESLVVGFDERDELSLVALSLRGAENGVEGLSVIDGEEARRLEPNLSAEVTCALRVRTGGICDPYEVALTALENAVQNGAEVAFDARVTSLERVRGGYVIGLAGGGRVCARAVVNAAGVHSAELHNLVCARKLHITPVRGDYLLYDPTLGSTFSRTIFQVPTTAGKGVLVSPTVHGNLFVGPSAEPQADAVSVATSPRGLTAILEGARRTWPQASSRGVITNFAGVRAKGAGHDFVIGEPDDAPGFFDVACLESPGLTSAPAVAVDIARRVARRLNLGARPDFEPRRAPKRRLALMDADQRTRAMREDPAWGHVVCRCSRVSEHEVVRELHGTLPVLCLDALKWRTSATMGRCHGGFCTPELLRIVSRELGVEPSRVEKRLRGSWMVSRSRPGYARLAAAASDEAAVGVPEPAQVYDVVVVGGGAAGMAAAASARAAGASVALIDREASLGGIMRQCIHNGFGLKRFSEELTGPEFASREAALLDGVDVWSSSSVLALHPGALHELEVVCPGGARSVRARSVVLACGSRERGFGALGIAGDRPSGIYTAGSAQAFINLHGCLPGRRAVILGSGDIGLIMARRMTLEGMEVEGVYELLDHPSGLKRNIVQCLDDFGIPLHLSHTVVATHGAGRLESVDIAAVDPATRRAIEGTEQNVACDTLVLSCGLIPENELAREAGVALSPVTGGALVDDRLETSIPGVFACGNALHVHDLADLAAAEGDAAGAAGASSARSGRVASSDPVVPVEPGPGVRYVVPQRLHGDGCPVTLSFRVSDVARDVSLEAVSELADGGEMTLRSRRARVVLPAEMERLEVTVSPEAALVASRVIVRVASANQKRGDA